jgi:hypothetical protein
VLRKCAGIRAGRIQLKIFLLADSREKLPIHQRADEVEKLIYWTCFALSGHLTHSYGSIRYVNNVAIQWTIKKIW